MVKGVCNLMWGIRWVYRKNIERSEEIYVLKERRERNVFYLNLSMIRNKGISNG